MDNRRADTELAVPYFMFEGMMARHERTIKHFIIALILVVLLMFVSNAIWVYEWSTYEYTGTSETVSIDGKEGVANYIGNDGDITNGSDSSDKKNKDTDKEKR